MKRILTYGTFDLLHYGHIRILKRAKEPITLKTNGGSLDQNLIQIYYLPSMV